MGESGKASGSKESALEAADSQAGPPFESLRVSLSNHLSGVLAACTILLGRFRGNSLALLPQPPPTRLGQALSQERLQVETVQHRSAGAAGVLVNQGRGHVFP